MALGLILCTKKSFSNISQQFHHSVERVAEFIVQVRNVKLEREVAS